MRRFSILFFLFTVLLVWTGCKKDDDNNELKAEFAWELTGNPGEVQFTNMSANAQSYEWNFDDGKQSTQESPLHVYEQNDTYIVTLKALATGQSIAFSDTLVVNNIP